MDTLEKQFFRDMQDIYRRADRECGYRATRFLQMLAEKGAVETAISLVSKPGGTEGFARLWEMNRLDLSVEALVLKDEYRGMFSDDLLETAEKRLKEYGYTL